MDNLLVCGQNFFGTATIYDVDFYNALAKHFNMYYYGQNYLDNPGNTSLRDVIEKNNIDIVLYQYYKQGLDEFLELRFDKKYLLLSDLQKHPFGVRRAEDISKIIEKSDLKAVLFRGLYGEYLKIDSDKMHFFPWSIDENTYSFSLKKDNDVCFLGCYGSKYPIRKYIKPEVRRFCGARNYSLLSGRRSGEAKTDINFMNKYSDKQIDRQMVGAGYVKALQRSKLMLFDSSIYKYPVKKYFECMATGCLILADKPHHAEEIGLIENRHFVPINKDNWKSKVEYYLKKKDEREKIVHRARKLFLKRHTNKVRIGQLLNIFYDADSL